MLTLQVIGNLGKDPEFKETQSGTKLARMSVAANKKVKGEKVTTWVNVTVFDEKKIEFMREYVRKGTKIFLEGEPQARAYEANGQPAASLDLTLGFGSKLEICSSEPRDNTGNTNGSASSRPAPTPAPAPSGGGWDDDLDDDLPPF